ncbi:uncharacterized protein LOC113471198 isoform X2 [Diaphorina citri]|uniref:Uncharacterized protein LOC113471198 isoform X1 n=1 Tax=Diaphorina citri TaxID=121845 RepID=A0A3Q0JGX4_DIACI|nr:uncharacterized protein LOC113471198 isoform X1 [Diaphorina citri]XP_026685956.1 uncharacterized protein LOC113471198 isoform X2 [Diaphorina citri]
MFSNNENKLYLYFLLEIIKKVNKVNTLFQSDQVDPSRLLDDLYDLFYSVISRIVTPSHLSKMKQTDVAHFDFKQYIMPLPCVQFGYEFNKYSSTVSSNILKEIQQNCLNYLVRLGEEIQQRLPANFSLLQKLNSFSPSVATSSNKPDITDIIMHFEKICSDPAEVLSKWNLVQNISGFSTDSTETFWSHVNTIKNSAGDKRYQHILELVLPLLCIPFSNAAVERSFSVMNIIKSKIRNRMSILTTDAILRVRYVCQNECHKFSPTKKMLDKFCSEVVYNTEETNCEILDSFNETLLE